MDRWESPQDHLGLSRLSLHSLNSNGEAVHSRCYLDSRLSHIIPIFVDAFADQIEFVNHIAQVLDYLTCSNC